MGAWLLTWNQENWHEGDWNQQNYYKLIDKTKKGEVEELSWTCSNSNVEIGDRVFLMKTGNMPRGIIASGHATTGSFEAPHYDPEKKKAGVMAKHITVAFDSFVDGFKGIMLQQDDLKEAFPEQTWSPMASGIAIKDEYVSEIERMWTDLTMGSNDLLRRLQGMSELIPDEYDGCYELMRETVDAYSRMNDISVLDYKDLNLVYLMSVINVKHGIDKKIKTIKESHLPVEDKQHLCEVLDSIWQNTKDGKYTHLEEGKVAVGLFGTGFYSFERNTTPELTRRFISMCIDVSKLDEDSQMYDRVEPILKDKYRGMRAAAASMVLHCLKPYSFPILNGNMGSDDIFSALGIELKKKIEVSTYIENSRKIKIFRDSNLPFKNYRILDLAAQELNKSGVQIDFSAIEQWIVAYSGTHYKKPENATDKDEDMSQVKELGTYARNQFIEYGKKVLDKFPDFLFAGCSNWVNQGQIVPDYFWIELKRKGLEDKPFSISLAICKFDSEVILSARVEVKDVSCKEGDFEQFNRMIYEIVPENSGCHFDGEDISGNYKYIGNIQGEAISAYETGEYKKIRIIKNIDNPYEASRTEQIINDTIEAVNILMPSYDKIFENKVNGVKKSMVNLQKTFDRNMILYGPPGTGKTYNTAIYAVAICDGKSLQEVEDLGYEAVKERYNELMENESRIAFTTFHQSYGYEEFIEGIRPVMDDEIDSNELQYKIVPGVFKAFCERAKEEKIQAPSLGIRENPVVWNVLLDGSGASELKTRCFENDYIKIGWTDVEANVTDQTKGITNQARTILTNFQDEMQEGDIVLVQAHNTSVDGIAVITGEYKYDEKDEDFPRTRKVKWIAKNINEDVLALNKNVRLDRKTVYPLRNMQVADVMKLVEKYSKSSITVEKNEKPYVFIIDEINRGNISKIFGELITLIEETKRLGEEEAMTAILPYSGSAHPFGVPNNVYILGTMNTADRSIALMDTALRRRFNFVEMMPKDELLQGVVVEKNGIVVNIQKLLKDINIRIEFLFDREHTIGQAFFWGLKKDPTVEKLGEIFKKSVVPLLQEYFYDDYEKIQLVLGDTGKADAHYKFILNEEVAPNKIFRGRTNLEKEQKYKIQESAFDLIESYEGILNPEE
ncbi:MAG: restriction system component [Herbinix sp.]|jgi:predicted RNA-binding protein with PUA domain|nr:restriction system component [Herbinix sp.]